MSTNMPLRLLLIDDDVVDRMAVKRALRAVTETEMEIVEASDGDEALRRLERERFDCALLDFRLPDLDGLDVLKRAQRAGVKTPIIMLTGQGSEEVAVEMMKSGAADYLPKGRASMDQLWKSIRSAVRVYHAELREDAARAERQRAKRRLQLLADAGAVLGSSLDYETTLGDVARLSVPHLADWCAIDMLESDGSIRCLAVAHVDPTKVQQGWELRRRFPIDRAELRGVAHVLRSGVPELYPQVASSTIQNGSHDSEYLRICRELGMTSAMIVPLKVSGRTLGAMTLICTDPSRQLNQEDLLLAEDLARRAAAAVENARNFQQAQAANRAKDQFLAALSHELRTPLTPVLTMVQSLESDTSLNEDARSAVEMIQRNVELEARLIDDLLDLTRVAKGKLQLDFSIIDAHSAIRGALDICMSDIRTKNLSVNVELNAASHHVRADGARLHQVMWNLIKNAAKFTPQGGSITISTCNPDGDGQSLRIDVSDSGIGIEPEALPRIFDAFEQADPNITQHFGGLGLGLAISKALVDLHQGSLIATSEGAGCGATFTVVLDTVPAPASATSATKPTQSKTASTASCVPGPAALSRAHRARILMVDDHPDTSTALKRLLSGLGYDVRAADSVQAALSAADSERFDLLISDIGLPDGTGLDLMRELQRREGRNGAVKAIALSGFGMEDDVRRSLDAGFKEHLTKPVNLQKLQALIEQMVG